MRILRSTAIRAAFVAGLTLTMAGTAGGASALATATASARPAVSGVTWHKLKLINGWQSSAGIFNTGDPAWAERDGVVYLAGSLHLPAGSTPEFARLPAAARPAHNTFVTIYTDSGTYGNLSIAPSGGISAFSPTFSNAAGYTSLAGISYLAAATSPGHRLTLHGGWQSGQTAFGSGNPSVTLRGHVVYLSGSLTGGTNPLFAVLPKPDRPAHSIWLEVDTFAGVAGELEIFSNGDMFAFMGSATDFTSLTGVSFLAASVHRNTIKLVNHWTSAQHVFNTGNPGYAVLNGIVYLSGGLSQGTGSNVTIGMLPHAARPSHNLYLHVYNAGAVVGTVFIGTGGRVEVYDTPQPDAAQALALLSGLSYPDHE